MDDKIGVNVILLLPLWKVFLTPYIEKQRGTYSTLFPNSPQRCVPSIIFNFCKNPYEPPTTCRCFSSFSDMTNKERTVEICSYYVFVASTVSRNPNNKEVTKTHLFFPILLGLCRVSRIF